ncbi:unnamed protein product [Rhizoctonia solani]|nr:unnamed protein product [Rhizoctonia solani]
MNNLFMLIVDPIRSNTYLGCFLAQTVINFVNGVLLAICFVFADIYGLYNPRFPAYLAFGVSIPLNSVCSLCLLALNLQSANLLQPMVPLRQIWRFNTKDVFMGKVTPLKRTCALSVLGYTRATQPKIPQIFPILGRSMAHLLFRRIKPVETRMYAFARNMFAVACIVVIIYRAVTALLQAQNQIETRMKSDDCNSRASYHHSIQLLVEVDTADRPNLIVKHIPGDDIVAPWGSNDMAAFYFELRRSNTQLTSIPLPYIWLSNGEEQKGNAGLPLTRAQAVRSYLPLWELRPGVHIEAEAKLITRRLIKSSIWRDIIFNLDPTYTTLSLYPIVDLGMSNYSTRNIASARISTKLNPGFVYFRDHVAPPYRAPHDTCDLIEDYRSSTVFDVIGSVGGLFALLQSINIFLFGRPLFWGLNGAKLISPFGLLGGFSSKNFKRRLGEQYHTKSNQDNSVPVKIRTSAFLRDFVIDFGPADIDPEQYALYPSESSSPILRSEQGDIPDPLIPLEEMGFNSASQSTTNLQEIYDTDGNNHNTIRNVEQPDDVV